MTRYLITFLLAMQTLGDKVDDELSDLKAAQSEILIRLSANEEIISRLVRIEQLIQELEPQPCERGLVAHYKFDGTGPVAIDSSGNGHHGVIHGAKRGEGHGRKYLIFSKHTGP